MIRYITRFVTWIEERVFFYYEIMKERSNVFCSEPDIENPYINGSLDGVDSLSPDAVQELTRSFRS